MIHYSPLIEAICFDWDGTIIQLCDDRFLKMATTTLETLGYPAPTLEELNAKGSVREFFTDAVSSEKLEEALSLYDEVFCADKISESELMPGARALLDLLRSFGVPMAVVSNLNTNLVQAQADMLGLTDYFDAIIGAQDSRPIKPDPAPLEAALSQLGLKPGPGIWFVGDTISTDIHCANTLSCSSVWISGPKTHAHIKPVISINNLDELQEMVKFNMERKNFVNVR